MTPSCLSVRTTTSTKKLHEALGDRAGEVLDALRDIAWRPAFASDFEPTPAFRNAMMRENGAQRARRFGRAWALGEQITERPAFDYVGTIEGADIKVEGEFDFSATDPVPGRIVGLIGRNAVGKTRYLASLGSDLAQISRRSAEALEARGPVSGRPSPVYAHYRDLLLGLRPIQAPADG